MGVGKTEFVKQLCSKFHSDTVASPTFAIHHRYSSKRGAIDHLDLYRLENEDELETTGFWDFLSSDEGLIFIEWPERMNLDHLPFAWKVHMIELRFLAAGAHAGDPSDDLSGHLSDDPSGNKSSANRVIKVFERQVYKDN